MNEFAVSSAQIGSGLNESASALATANNSLEESAAMLTAITEITQDAASAGNALKTLSLRLRSTKAELTEMGEESEGAFDTVAKMQEHIKGITGFDILNEKGDYKSTYEIMRGIASVYEKLSDTERASLLESLAGKTRANQVAALLNNFKTAEKALDASLNSMGTAVKENAIYLDSIEGRLASLKSTAQSTSQNLIDTQAIKTVVSLVDGLLQLAEAIITVDENIAQLGTKKFDEDTALNTTKYFESWGKFPSIIGAVTLALSALNKQLGRIMPLIPVME